MPFERRADYSGTYEGGDGGGGGGRVVHSVTDEAELELVKKVRECRSKEMTVAYNGISGDKWNVIIGPVAH